MAHKTTQPNNIDCGLNVYISKVIINSASGYKYIDYKIINKSLGSSNNE